MSQMLLFPGKVTSQFSTICPEDLSPASNIFLNFPHLFHRETVADPDPWQKTSSQIFVEEQDEEDGGEDRYNQTASHWQVKEK